MSCPGDLNVITSSTNTTTNNYAGYNSSTSNNTTLTNNDRAQYNNNLKKNNPIFAKSKCRKISNRYPRFTPVIFSLSMNTSVKNRYSVVYINGLNYLPPCIGSTYVNFGQYKELPIIYFNSNYLSFTIPLSAKAGIYSIVVVNVYNGNFSQPVNTSYAGNLNYSNALKYTIT